MKIVCIGLAQSLKNSQQSPDNNTVTQSSVLPEKFKAVIVNLIDAGHEVNWIEQPLCPLTVDEAITEVTGINPDVLFFACDAGMALPLMATVAVRCAGSGGGDYICDGMLRPARQWCNTLANPDLSVLSLIDKIQQNRGVTAGDRAMNDSWSVNPA